MKSIDLNKPVEIPSWLRIAARPTSIGSGELERQWLEIGEEATEAILKVLPTGKYTLGPYLTRLKTNLQSIAIAITGSAFPAAQPHCIWHWKPWE